MNPQQLELFPLNPDIRARSRAEYLPGEESWDWPEAHQALGSVPVVARPLTQEEYELYNRLPNWLNAQLAKAQTARRLSRNFL